MDLSFLLTRGPTLALAHVMLYVAISGSARLILCKKSNGSAKFELFPAEWIGFLAIMLIFSGVFYAIWTVLPDIPSVAIRGLLRALFFGIGGLFTVSNTIALITDFRALQKKRSDDS